MRIFLDACVNRRIVRPIAGHDIRTARQMGWTSITNGALRALGAAQFDVLVTVDKNLPNQQNLTGLDLAVIVLVAPTNQLEDLLPLMPALLAAIPACSKGAATFVDSSR